MVRVRVRVRVGVWVRIISIHDGGGVIYNK